MSVGCSCIFWPTSGVYSVSVICHHVANGRYYNCNKKEPEYLCLPGNINVLGSYFTDAWLWLINSYNNFSLYSSISVESIDRIVKNSFAPWWNVS